MGLCVMRASLVCGSSPMLLARASFSFFVAYLSTMVACVESSDDDSPHGWGVGSPFVGVSVSMMRCLVILLFLAAQLSVVAFYAAAVSRYKSFAAVVAWFVAVAAHSRLQEARKKSEEDKSAKRGAALTHASKEQTEYPVGSALWLLRVSSRFFATTEHFPPGSFCPKC
ncbi:hypothetical protein [Candidatus Anaplasma sp. TIGMIC]|uniref:hypothetical protein n=1 Tax=Candidatus Anaplasma sp. TIGMIC TaxID=3020713 RepID=UPI00232F2936|nr:hypothetical protein [Candidatus Anaplasma sp. TIGMIC]MDB1135491.1 hypothetical protein [Candidatus Anaplasma sp. TIGMIC]